MVALDKPTLVENDETSVQPTHQVMSDVGKSSVATVELPSGYLDEAGLVHTEMQIREMDGRDEDLLANSKVPVQSRLNRLIENCILSIGTYKQGCAGWSDIVLSLPIIDRLWTIVQIRILTVGPIFSAKVKCQNEECGEVRPQAIDLNELKVKGLLNPEKRSYSGTLPKTKKSFVCKIFTGADEGKLSKLSQKYPDDLVSLAIASRILSLAEKPAPISIAELKALPSADRQHLRNLFQKNEGELDRKMECTCPVCENDFTESIELGDSSFFFPSET